MPILYTNVNENIDIQSNLVATQTKVRKHEGTTFHPIQRNIEKIKGMMVMM